MEFLHHHSGIHEAEACKVCVLSVTLSKIFVPVKDILFINNSFEFLNLEPNVPLVSLTSQYPDTGRAPPSLLKNN